MDLVLFIKLSQVVFLSGVRKEFKLGLIGTTEGLVKEEFSGLNFF